LIGAIIELQKIIEGENFLGKDKAAGAEVA